MVPHDPDRIRDVGFESWTFVLEVPRKDVAVRKNLLLLSEERQAEFTDVLVELEDTLDDRIADHMLIFLGNVMPSTILPAHT